MTRPKLPSHTAALAGVPSGVQAIGPWTGRREIFVKFADEAETATIYTADALKGELKRLASRSPFHSIAIAGRDPLAECDFLCAALEDAPLPVLLDHDGQRPDSLGPLLDMLKLVQVTHDGSEQDGALERTAETLRTAAGKQVAHALVLIPGESASDARLLRIVEQAHAASASAMLVLHAPAPTGDSDRRWTLWLERASGLHGDVRLLTRLPAPIGMR